MSELGESTNWGGLRMDVCALLATELRAALGRGGEHCKHWITGMRGEFTGTPITPQAAPASSLNFKMA